MPSSARSILLIISAFALRSFSEENHFLNKDVCRMIFIYMMLNIFHRSVNAPGSIIGVYRAA